MRLDKLKNLTDSDRRMIVAVLGVIGAVAIRSWLVNPHLASLHATQRYEQAVKTAIGESKSLGLQLRGSRLELDRLQAQRAALAQGIFRPAEAEPFFGELERLCAEAQCTVLSSEALEKRTPTLHNVSDANVPITRKAAKLTLQGDYGSLTRLIEKLQTYPRKIWIDMLTLALPPAGSGITCDLEISIYIFRSKENESHD
jgi:hypothetical protein